MARELDRALFLNLTFWGASEGGDVLVDAHVPADVVRSRGVASSCGQSAEHRA